MMAAVLAALGAACGFAISTSLQHRAATSATPSVLRNKGLVSYLLRRPSWHLGLLVGGFAFTLHAVAVTHGALAVVQPIMVSGLVFALPVRAALDRRRPAKAEIAWAAVTATGLALFVVASRPATESGGPRASLAVLFMVAGFAAAAACSQIGMNATSDLRRGLLLGSASGILFGLVAGTLKLVIVHPGGGIADVGLVAALVVLGAWGLVLNQCAYQVAPLSVSMPVLNIVDVLVAIGFGFYVFREIPDHRPAALLAEAIGIALMGLGARRLARGAVAPPPAPGPDGVARDAELVSTASSA